MRLLLSALVIVSLITLCFCSALPGTKENPIPVKDGVAYSFRMNITKADPNSSHVAQEIYLTFDPEMFQSQIVVQELSRTEVFFPGKSPKCATVTSRPRFVPTDERPGSSVLNFDASTSIYDERPAIKCTWYIRILNDQKQQQMQDGYQYCDAQLTVHVHRGLTEGLNYDFCKKEEEYEQGRTDPKPLTSSNSTHISSAPPLWNTTAFPTVLLLSNVIALALFKLLF